MTEAATIDQPTSTATKARARGNSRKLPPGLKLRGSKYYAWFTEHGRTVRKVLSSDLKTAIQMLNDIRARMDRKEYGITDNEADLDDVKAEYLEHCRQHLKPRSAERIEHSLTMILPKLAVKKVSGLTPRAIVAYRQQRLAAGRSPRTVNMEVQALQTMLRWAIRFGLIGSSPIAEIRPLRHDNPKEGRSLTDVEVESLLGASPQPWRDVWHAYLVTGLRKMELAALKWRDIDWESREIVIRSSVAKNHTQRRIPIENALWDILKALHDARDARAPGVGKTPAITARVQALFTREHVFTTTQSTPMTNPDCIYGAFLRCCKLAGIITGTFDEAGTELDHVDVHSLRRTFATNLIVSGADPKTVQDLMGHKSLAMTMNLYAKIHTSNRRQAVAKLSYGNGAEAPAHVVAPTIRIMKQPAAHRMRTNERRVALAAT